MILITINWLIKMIYYEFDKITIDIFDIAKVIMNKIV